MGGGLFLKAGGGFLNGRWLLKRCQCRREFCFTWVSPNQCIIGLFQLFVGRLLKGSYPYIQVEV